MVLHITMPAAGRERGREKEERGREKTGNKLVHDAKTCPQTHSSAALAKYRHLHWLHERGEKGGREKGNPRNRPEPQVLPAKSRLAPRTVV